MGTLSGRLWEKAHGKYFTSVGFIAGEELGTNQRNVQRSDYVIKLKQMTSFYDVRGEVGYFMRTAKIMASTGCYLS